jgi:hypothetical protein
LEQALGGISKNSGAEYGLVYKPGSTSEIFGYVRYILPNSDATDKTFKENYFSGVNGTLPLAITRVY